VRDGFGTKSFSYGQPAFVGRHRFGVSNHVTSGFHGEFARSGGTAGSDVTVSTSLGELEFHTAGSVTTGDMPQRGVAGIVGYGYHGRRSSLRTVLRGTTRHFSTLSLEPEHDRNLVEQVTSTSHVVGSSTSLNTEIAFSLLRDGGPSSRYRAALNRRVTNQLTLQFVGSSSFDTSLWEHNLFVTMSWSLPAQHNAELTERFGTRVSNVTARVSRSMQETTDVGYQLSGSTGQMRHATANVHGQAPFGRMSATYTNFEGEAHTILEASGSVVFIGGRPYLSRPVTQSFALLEVPGAADVRGYLNNREVGRTGADGRLFVPELLPYQANKLRVEQSDLPLDYTLTEEEIVVAPPNRGGSVVAFPAHRIRLLRGRIVRQVGSGMMPIAYGTLTVPTREGVLSSPLGQAGEFEIEGLQPGQWRGTVSRGRRACEVTLHVPSGGEGPVQQLGVIRCSGRAGAAP
jgi:outer membrane usher protein